ncbi:MAG: hypothetical protein LLF76_10865 [Planctomycetaceae bacterium]|nr:hypothetical protein [Planctomycetaceae bacterium]
MTRFVHSRVIETKPMRPTKPSHYEILVRPGRSPRLQSLLSCYKHSDPCNGLPNRIDIFV